MGHGDKAVQMFKSGMNCAQSVFCAFAEDYGIDKETAQKISSGFGGGMGRMREVCGAVSGMFMVYGLMHGYTDSDSASAKGKTYTGIQELAGKFKQECGSIICRELLGLNRNENNSPQPTVRSSEFYKKRPCTELVRIACDILDEKENRK